MRARLSSILCALPRVRGGNQPGSAPAGGSASAAIAHVFGGEDQLFRITFRAESDEVMAFEHLGEPYSRSGWGANVVGVLPRRRHGLDRAGRSSPIPTACRRPRASPIRSPGPTPEHPRLFASLPAGWGP